ncbi:hypothetical protein HDU93_007947 [Gonapodya sp. JEL0774]|nr:hypothetical protein HDU93_007947 [Gonapodya sp. JEL0774]
MFAYAPPVMSGFNAAPQPPPSPAPGAPSIASPPQPELYPSSYGAPAQPYGAPTQSSGSQTSQTLDGTPAMAAPLVRKFRAGYNDVLDKRDAVPAQREPVRYTPEQILSILVSLQHFDGSFASDARVFGISPAIRATPPAGRNPEEWATAVAIALMQVRLAAQKYEWELMADNAVAWLDGRVGEEERKRLVEKAASVLWWAVGGEEEDDLLLEYFERAVVGETWTQPTIRATTPLTPLSAILNIPPSYDAMRALTALRVMQSVHDGYDLPRAPPDGVHERLKEIVENLASNINLITGMVFKFVPLEDRMQFQGRDLPEQMDINTINNLAVNAFGSGLAVMALIVVGINLYGTQGYG